MNDQDALSRARYIFTTGRRLHDRVHRIAAGECMRNANEKFGELSASQMNMIMMIRVRETVSVTELASLLCVSPPSVSAMVDRLVERGLLTRTPCSQDRRKVVIRISPEAIKDIALVEERILSSFVQLVKALGPETAEKWCAVLQEIGKVLDEDQRTASNG